MSEILKILQPIIAIFFGNLLKAQNLKEKSLRLSSEILQQIRRILILISLTFGAFVLFCISVGYFIDRTLNLLDHGSFYFTPSLIFLIVFMIVCLLIFVYSTNKNVWTEAFKKDQQEDKKEQETTSTGPSPIETAISLFILDFIKEREMSRNDKHENQKDHHPASTNND